MSNVSNKKTPKESSTPRDAQARESQARDTQKRDSLARDPFKIRDPFEGVPYGVNALIRNEGSTVEEVRLSDLELGDDLWRLRPSSNLELLTESIKLSGQRTPVVLRFKEANGKWQIVSGFRRVEALIKLRRHGVLARLFDTLSEEDAVQIAINDNFFSGDLHGEHLDFFMERLRNENLLAGPVLDFLDWAREKISLIEHRAAPAAAPAAQAVDKDEMSLPELIDRTFVAVSDASQGLERIFLNWSDVTPPDRKLLAAECKYIHDLYPFLTR